MQITDDHMLTAALISLQLSPTDEIQYLTVQNVFTTSGSRLQKYAVNFHSILMHGCCFRIICIVSGHCLIRIVIFREDGDC